MRILIKLTTLLLALATICVFGLLAAMNVWPPLDQWFEREVRPVARSWTRLLRQRPEPPGLPAQSPRASSPLTRTTRA